MKDYCTSYKDQFGHYFYNEKLEFHRLNGPAGDEGYRKYYYICGYNYMNFYKRKDVNNELCILRDIIRLPLEYHIYIKQNINNLIQEYNPEIKFISLLTKEEINELPNFIKDLIIL